MKIDLKSIIETRQLDVDQLAKNLFPANKYPKLALNRVLSGEANLDEVQIAYLATSLNTSIDDLYSNQSWKAKSSEGIHVFEKDGYKVELNTETWISKIFHQETLIHESVIHNASIALSTYLEEIDKTILTLKQTSNETR